eukprot:COSAG01_NODE_33441_length_564_cov_0.655914_1_plen_59_part_10
MVLPPPIQQVRRYWQRKMVRRAGCRSFLGERQARVAAELAATQQSIAAALEASGAPSRR